MFCKCFTLHVTTVLDTKWQQIISCSLHDLQMYEYVASFNSHWLHSCIVEGSKVNYTRPFCTVQLCNWKRKFTECWNLVWKFAMTSVTHTTIWSWRVQNVKATTTHKITYNMFYNSQSACCAILKLDPHCHPDCHQNLITGSLGHAPLFQKTHRNPFVTCW